ncbi:Exocyst component 84 C-terminal [Rhizoctonia solani]|uniref:Exocyst complex component EXO84 n=1 Tax=Rhizoctonia solani TaxID=456999 RepID=A0A8H7M0F5_9AGAM|nr:Exocyst component 84 C-terminal [Rhizoctonia solani]
MAADVQHWGGRVGWQARPGLLLLSHDVLLEVVSLLDVRSLLSVRQVCRVLNAITHENIIFVRLLKQPLPPSVPGSCAEESVMRTHRLHKNWDLAALPITHAPPPQAPSAPPLAYHLPPGADAYPFLKLETFAPFRDPKTKQASFGPDQPLAPIPIHPLHSDLDLTQATHSLVQAQFNCCGPQLECRCTCCCFSPLPSTSSHNQVAVPSPTAAPAPRPTRVSSLPIRAIFAKIVGRGRWGIFVIKRDPSSKGKQRADDTSSSTQPLTLEALASLGKGKAKELPPLGASSQSQPQPVDEGAFLVIYDLEKVLCGSEAQVAEHPLKNTPSTITCPGAGSSLTTLLRWDYTSPALVNLSSHKAGCMLGAISIAELETEKDQPARTLVAIVHRPRTVMIQDVDSNQRCFIKLGKSRLSGLLLALRSVQAEEAMYALEEYELPPMGQTSQPTSSLQRQWIRSPDLQNCTIIEGPTRDDGSLLTLRFGHLKHTRIGRWHIGSCVLLLPRCVYTRRIALCLPRAKTMHEQTILPAPQGNVRTWRPTGCMVRTARTLKVWPGARNARRMGLHRGQPRYSSRSKLHERTTEDVLGAMENTLGVAFDEISGRMVAITCGDGNRFPHTTTEPQLSKLSFRTYLGPKMKSLRTRRSTPSTVPQSRPPKQKLSKSNKDARKSRVDDKMKRRMSARYADISDPRDAEVPDMPDLRDLRRIAQSSVGGPAHINNNNNNNNGRHYHSTFDDEDDEDGGLAGIGSSTGVARREEPRVDVLDVRDLQEEFDPDAYLRSKLASSTEAELRAFQTALQTTKDATALDLQKNVFKNYSDFVVISKEISTLENDMLELKASLQEWKNMPTLLALDPSTSNTTGSATFVPTIPGRHIIAEASDLQQLNAATYRPEHGAHIVLLDDTLLVARRRRGRLVADRAWQLGEISLVDVRDTSELQNVFKIKRGQDTFVYRTERLSDKRALLSQFRKAAEELAARKRKEREGEHEKSGRKSLVFDAIPALPAWMAEMAAGSGGAAAKAEQDERWINGFIDELTVAVALRDWDSAVNLVVKGQGRTAMMPGLSSKLTPLAEQLTADLLGALADPAQRRSSTIKLVAYIVRLGPDALVRARDMFLNARASLMRRRVRAIRFEGDVRAYIKELALIVFTSVKHTADWYLASFKDFEMASGMIRWAKEQVEDFAKLFCIQVYGSETNEYDPTHSEEDTTLLRDIGMDFSFVLLDLISLPAPPSETKPQIQTQLVPEISLPSTPTESLASRPPRPPRSPAPPPPRSRDREREVILLLLALGICRGAVAWNFLAPTRVLERHRVQVDLTSHDAEEYNWPYVFEVWKNVSSSESERIHVKEVWSTPMFWNNNQPAGSFIRFRVWDANDSVRQSSFIQVQPNTTTSTSTISMVSTRLGASINAKATLTSYSTNFRIATILTSGTKTAFPTAMVSSTSANAYTGAIAGGVVGGVLLLAIITAALIFFLRRRQSRPHVYKEKMGLFNQPAVITPFIYEGPPQTRTQPQRYDEPSRPCQDAEGSPPCYSPPPSNLYPSTYTTPSSTKKGAYTPVSTVPH